VYAEAAGIARIVPLAVAVPDDEADVVTLVRWAAATRTPLIARGSGSSMSGGAVGRGVIVDLSRLRWIEPVDEQDRSVRAGPGAVCADIDGAARAHGLRFPVDPSSARFCTLGGMTATNAAGAHSLSFGATRPWVRALRCVFADGTVADVRRGAAPPEVPALTRLLALTNDLRAGAAATRHDGVRKDSSGYGVAAFAASDEVIDLLVGSEGTLALFVGVELALAPVAGATSSVFGAFARLEDAVTAATQARELGAVACELLDRTFLEVAASGGRGTEAPAGTESALLAEVEGDDAAAAATRALRLHALFTTCGATAARVALEQTAETELWELRHAASPILARLDPSLRSMQFIEDGAVPPERLPEYVRGVRDALARAGMRGVIFGHAGDAHVHVNPLVDVSHPDWRARVERVLDEVTALVASLGGTLDGEHGDGRLRTPLLPRVWSGEARRLFARVKEAFDPQGILNPGVKIPEAAVDSLGAIKYDPALPPLPAAARRALTTVERERAYARFRLDLLDDAR
jgi:FAD/FMN-containing dehydrogenase